MNSARHPVILISGQPSQVLTSINGLPFPETGIEVPVGINLKLNGTFRLLLSEMKT